MHNPQKEILQTHGSAFEKFMIDITGTNRMNRLLLLAVVVVHSFAQCNAGKSRHIVHEIDGTDPHLKSVCEKDDTGSNKDCQWATRHFYQNDNHRDSFVHWEYDQLELTEPVCLLVGLQIGKI